MWRLPSLFILNKMVVWPAMLQSCCTGGGGLALGCCRGAEHACGNHQTLVGLLPCLFPER